MKKSLTIILVIVIILAVGAGTYWYLYLRAPGYSSGSEQAADQTGGFAPLNRPSSGGGDTPANSDNTDGTGTSTITNTPVKIPTLRLLSNTPVGGYGASTTGATTTVRWIDRGRGNVYEANYSSLYVTTLSNTLLPRTYTSVWNKNLTAFIGSLLEDGSMIPTTVYAELRPRVATSSTPYELKGKNMPSSIVSYAVSPKKDRVFLFSIENGRGIGYVAPMNGGNAKEIFNTPVTQVNVDWPENNTIAITTKGSAAQVGFLYFVNPDTGVWREIIGPLPGLSTKVSHDAKHILISATGNNNNVLTSIYDTVKKSGTDAVIRTIADKCSWGNFYKDMVYCAVPAQPVAGVYPDDWYKGTLSTVDKIWQVNSSTNEVHLVSSIVDQSDRVIDAFNLGLDDKDNYLFFMNKNDLSLWSLDLVKGN